MKKLAYILVFAFILANFTACKKSEQPKPKVFSSGTASIVESSLSEIETSNSPEEKAPAGEPTFLTAPDGTPIYTSEITRYQDSAEFQGTHEQFPLEQFNEETFKGRDTAFDYPEVVCEGFAYAFIPRVNISRYGSPEKFIERGGVAIYNGEEYPKGNDYFRLNVGEKFVGLTVKNASTTFSYENASYAEDDYSGNLDGIPGLYLSTAEIQFEGTVEMTGYLEIREDEGYSTSGDMHFYPDSESASKLPNAVYSLDRWNPESGIFYEAFQSSDGYGDLCDIFLGNMNDCASVDFSGLQPGDNAHVKLTIKDPRIFYGSAFGELADIEVLEMLER